MDRILVSRAELRAMGFRTHLESLSAGSSTPEEEALSGQLAEAGVPDSDAMFRHVRAYAGDSDEPCLSYLEACVLGGGWSFVWEGDERPALTSPGMVAAALSAARSMASLSASVWADLDCSNTEDGGGAEGANYKDPTPYLD